MYRGRVGEKYLEINVGARGEKWIELRVSLDVLPFSSAVLGHSCT
jgi:hypothetical protein